MNRLQLVKLGLLALMILTATLMAQPLIASEGHDGHHEGAAGEGEAVHFGLIMGEFFFQVEGLAPGEPLMAEAGQRIALEIVNEGKLMHEAMFGVIRHEDHGYMENFFEHMDVKIKQQAHMEGADGAAEFEVDGLIEVELDPRMSTMLEFTVPAEYAGQTFEIGCFIPGHYEAGMKLSLMVMAAHDEAMEDHEDEDHEAIKDADNDGIPDEADYCPTYPGEELKNGC